MTKLPRLAIVLSLFGSLALPGERAAALERRPNIDTVVVCASSLLPALRPWIEFRRRQGRQIALLGGDESPAEIRDAIRTLARQTDLRYVVLVGDAAHNGDRGANIPAHQAPSQVIHRWGAEPTFATDNWYADLDDDGVPELAVGRLSTDSPGVLSGVVAKILAYERSRDVGLWRRRVNFVAGVGGFGPIVDVVLETTAKQLITAGIPAAYRTTMTQASWRSPYAPDPRRFREETIERLSDGCFAWVYLGHGQARELDYFRVPGGALPILTADDAARIASRHGSPFAVFLSCYAGAYDAEQDCLAEALLEAPGGPVAVVAGASVTMPYAMTVMGRAMLRQLFSEQRETIGEVLLHAKQELARDPEADGGLLDKIALLMSPHPEQLGQERREHVQLFNLIGDPLLRIRQPGRIELEVADEATAGDVLHVRGMSEVDGPCVIELVCRRDRLTFKPRRRTRFEPTEDGLRAMQETYAKANDCCWCSKLQQIEDGKFAAVLPIPDRAAGPSHVRVYVRGENDFAMGAADVYLRLPEVNQENQEAAD